MGLFNRKSKEAAVPVPELPPTLSDADLAAAAGLLDRWDAAMGNSDAMWACIDDFARLGGYRGYQKVTLETGPGGKSYDDVMNRPWRWWAEAALLANARGEYALAARIFLLALFIVKNTIPRSDWALQMDTGLVAPIQGTYQSIAASAADALAQLPPDQLILDNAVDKVTVAAALNGAKLAATQAGI